MNSLVIKLTGKIENKLLEYKRIQQLEDENSKLELAIKEFKDNEFTYNPEYPNYNTPFAFIDFEEVVSFNTEGTLVLVRTHYETYTLNMKSDEYFFEFIKKLIPVGEKTLIGKERLIMNHEYYNFNVDMTETVDVTTIRNLVYRIHGKPKKKFKENAISNSTLTDYSAQERQKRLFKRFGGWAEYSNGVLKFK